jgi:hypothetical protein
MSYVSKTILTIALLWLSFALRHWAGVPPMTFIQHAADAVPLCLCWSIWNTQKKNTGDRPEVSLRPGTMKARGRGTP